MAILTATAKPNEQAVTLEICFLSNDTIPVFNPTHQNKVSVIIANNSNDHITFYENWNSWGYDNFFFIIETHDSIYRIKKKDRLWWRNFPSTFIVPAGKKSVLNFNLSNQTPQVWSGLPIKNYDCAKIKVLYTITTEKAVLCQPRMNYENWREKLEDSLFVNEIIYPSFRDSANTSYDTVQIYSGKLVSKSVDIKIQ